MIIILLLNLGNTYGGHFEGEPVENERDAKFWVRLLNGPSHEIFVLSVKQTHLILAFSLCLLHKGHNLDPDDSEVLFHLALNHALMRQVRINSKIINCCVLWDGWFEQWGGTQRSMKKILFFELEKIYCRLKLVQKNYQEKNSYLPLNHHFMDSLSMFCCRAFSRTLTCFLLYTLSTRWSVTIIPVVRFYFEFSAATDNVFLCSR